MEYMLRSYRKIYTLRDKQRTGVVTTANRKELYAIEAQKYIIQESIHIHEGFFSSNPHGTAKEEERVLEEFKKQVSMHSTKEKIRLQPLTHTFLAPRF